MTPPLDRCQIQTSYEWAYLGGHDMVIGTDLDSLLSGAYLHDLLGWEIIGFYDFERVYYAPGMADRLADAIWVDLDISLPKIRSIGHHILSFAPEDELACHKNTLNPNLECGIAGVPAYAKKYPLATIQFLQWLHEPDREFNLEHDALTWLADSSIRNAAKYRPNVERWVTETMPCSAHQSAFDVLNEGYFERHASTLCDYITSGTRYETSMSGDPSYFEAGSSLPRQSQIHFESITERKLDDVTTVVENICSVMGWSAPAFPTDLDEIVGSQNWTNYGQTAARYGSMDAWLENAQPFSYAIPYYNKLKTTNLQLG